MRLFLFFSLLSSTVLAAPCTDIDLINYTTPITCDSLTITGNLDLSNKTSVIEVTVNGGEVIINGDISLDGSPGTNGTGPGTLGGAAGPGGGQGGGIGNFPFDFPQAGETAGETGSGGAGQDDLPCSHGGGGGALFTVATAGIKCDPTATFNPGAAGGIATNLEFDFAAGFFKGGYGGGSGGQGASGEVGTGGGGGGAMHIITDGDVTISSGVTISSRGGNGGNLNSDGGGGGAGSGGALWIQSSAGVIINLGTIDLRGGTGGRNNATGGHGGDGGVGVYQFEDLNGTTNGSGLVLPPASTNGGTGGSSSKLSSDISCGTIAKASEQNQNNLFMIFAGFGFVSLISFLSKFKRIKVY